MLRQHVHVLFLLGGVERRTAYNPSHCRWEEQGISPMPSGLSQSHQEIAGQFQWELLQLTCLGSGGQHVQRPPPRGMGRPIGLQCPCNSFTRQEVRGASDSTNQRIENNALVSSSGLTGGARRVVYLVTSYSPVRGSAKDTRLRIHLDRQAIMVQTADGSPEEGASRNGDGLARIRSW